MRSALRVVLLFPISCVLRIRRAAAFDEYLQRDWRLIKSGNLTRYVILSLVIWEFNTLDGGSPGSGWCLSGGLASGSPIEMKSFPRYLIKDRPYLKTGVIASLIPPVPLMRDPFLAAACMLGRISGRQPCIRLLSPPSCTSNHATIIPPVFPVH